MSENTSLRIPEFIPYSHQSNHGSIQADTHKESDLQAVYEYVPTLKQSGYIIGNPIAYTNQPNLPPHFSNTSPKRIENSPSRFITSQYHNSQSSPNRSKSKSRIVTNITYTNPPPPHQTAYHYTGNSRVIPAPTIINSSPTSPSRPTSSMNFNLTRTSNQLVSK